MAFEACCLFAPLAYGGVASCTSTTTSLECTTYEGVGVELRGIAILPGQSTDGAVAEDRLLLTERGQSGEAGIVRMFAIAADGSLSPLRNFADGWRKSIGGDFDPWALVVLPLAASPIRQSSRPRVSCAISNCAASSSSSAFSTGCKRAVLPPAMIKAVRLSGQPKVGSNSAPSCTPMRADVPAPI